MRTGGQQPGERHCPVHCIQLPAFITTAGWQQWQAASLEQQPHPGCATDQPGTTRASGGCGARPGTQQEGVRRHKNRQLDAMHVALALPYQMLASCARG